MSLDVSEATFQTEVIDRSAQVPVIVDLWAPWCGPCRTLGPIIERVVDGTNGKAVLVKVNIDENPGIAQAFGVQSIPLVVALVDGQPVDGFLGAQPEHAIQEFVDRLLAGDGILDVEEAPEAQALLDAVEAPAEVAVEPVVEAPVRPPDDYDERLSALLASVKDDEAARAEYLQILETMGPEDERTAGYRRKLTNRLF
jgi:putative thioredoxin